MAAAAGVDETIFYEYFDNEEDAFLAVFDEAVAAVEAQIAVRLEPERDWCEQVTAAAEACLEAVLSEPDRAYLCLVESQQAGAAATGRYYAVRERASEWLKRGRDLGASDHDLPDGLETFVVSGVAWVIQRWLVARRSGRSSEDLSISDVLQFVLAPYMADPGLAGVGA